MILDEGIRLVYLILLIRNANDMKNKLISAFWTYGQKFRNKLYRNRNFRHPKGQKATFSHLTNPYNPRIN